MNPQQPADNHQPSAASTDKAAALRDRSLRVISELSAVSMPNVGRPDSDVPLLPILSEALATQHPDGSFGSDDSPRQKPCYTAQTITLMSRLGITYNKRADGNRATLGRGHSVLLAVKWLVDVQSEDGGWGEDAWDTCQVLLALRLCGYEATDPCVERALTLLHETVDAGWPDRSSYWFGPSFHGAAMQVFNAYRETDYAARTLSQIWEFWDDDSACFRSPDRIDGQHAPAEWQTACALSGLRSFGSMSPVPDRVDRAFAWLVKMQSSEGCWSPGLLEITGYCTLQAILALMLSSYPTNREAAGKGTQWFIDLLMHDSRLAVKLMTAAAITRTRSDELVTEISFYWAAEILDLLTEYGHLTEVLSNDIATEQRVSNQLAIAEERRTDLVKEVQALRASEAHIRAVLDSYAFKATANQLAVWGIVLGVVTFVLGVIVQIVFG